MSPNDEGGRPERPDYKVYKSRRFTLPGRDPGDGPKLGKDDAKPSRTPRAPKGPKLPKGEGEGGRSWLRIVGLILLGWLILSFLSFAISATIQKSKLADTGGFLGGNPLLVAVPQNILVLGTDVRSDEFASSEAVADKCVEAAASGQAPPAECSGSRADTIMILRAGGGAFEKLSIPRDVWAAIPGQDNQRINGAFAFGGAELQIQTVEEFLGIDIHHVAIVDFAGFRDFIDAIGGVKVDMPRRVCSEISGTFRISLPPGEVTLSGEKALVLARTRTSTCGPPIDDLDRNRFQQLILNGIKGRLTDPLRVPRNFLFGPLIGWNAPKAMVSDMGGLTMPQLAMAAVIGGSSDTVVLKPFGPGPSGSLFVPVEECSKAVRRLTGEAPERTPVCSPPG
ncbi:MAG: LCP family protein [Actinomycetota bacterium]|nr:LCP family protein [Actinomycetota bacterium]